MRWLAEKKKKKKKKKKKLSSFKWRAAVDVASPTLVISD